MCSTPSLTVWMVLRAVAMSHGPRPRLPGHTCVLRLTCGLRWDALFRGRSPPPQEDVRHTRAKSRAEGKSQSKKARTVPLDWTTRRCGARTGGHSVGRRCVTEREVGRCGVKSGTVHRLNPGGSLSVPPTGISAPESCSTREKQNNNLEFDISRNARFQHKCCPLPFPPPARARPDSRPR